jgi:hypothetical protein
MASKCGLHHRQRDVVLIWEFKLMVLVGHRKWVRGDDDRFVNKTYRDIQKNLLFCWLLNLLLYANPFDKQLLID